MLARSRSGFFSLAVSVASVLTVACSSPETPPSEAEIPLPDRQQRDQSDTTPPPTTKGAETTPGEPHNGNGNSNGGNNNPAPAAVACTTPAGCGASTPLCCGEVGLGEGSLPNCPVVAMKGTCAATCTTNLSATCPVTQKTRLCTKGSDCASDAPSCCYVEGGGLSGSICVPAFFADILQQKGSTCN